MIINKISQNYTHFNGFGKNKNKKAAQNATLVNNKFSKKKIALAISALGIAGIVIAAYKRPDLFSKFSSNSGNAAQKTDLNKAAQKAAETQKSAESILGSQEKIKNAQKSSIKTMSKADNEDSKASIGSLALAGVLLSGSDKEENTKKTTQKAIIPSDISLEEFEAQNGRLVKGHAYIEDEPYDGEILVTNNGKNYVLTFRDGELKKATKYIIDEENVPQAVLTKEYFTARNGEKTVEVSKRKISSQSYDSGKPRYANEWFTEEIITKSDDEIRIDYPTYHGTKKRFSKKQPDGTWNSYILNRGVDPYSYEYVTKIRDAKTGEVISETFENPKRKQRNPIKKFFSKFCSKM